MAAKPKRARPSRRSLTDEQRFAIFREQYLATGNAYKSALAAGYTAATAKTKSWKLAREIRVALADALRARGIDEVSQARKLASLQSARIVKWNPDKHPARTVTQGKTKLRIKASGGWDSFDDGDIQFRATQEINRLLDAYPAPKDPDKITPVQIIFPASFGAVAMYTRAQSEAKSV